MSLRSTVASSAKLRRRPIHPLRHHVVIRQLSQQRPSLDAPSPSRPEPSLASTSVLKTVDVQRTGGQGSNPDGPGELSDQEWEIRTGRAIYILQQTLPTFFSTGLISSVDTSGTNSRTNEDDDVSIYSPNIRLEYRPPTPFPPPFPRTLHVEGLPLYLASSSFVRHTLSALYTDLRVELQRVRVHGPRSSSGLSPDGATPGADTPEEILQPQQQGKTRSLREKSLFIGLVVRGINRVSKAEGGWEVNSTYTFSPITGLIHIHNIDSIHPAPHLAFFSALQAALSKIGLGGTQGETGAGGVARSSPPSLSAPQPLPSVADRS
ncbi:hypothetical protein L226DRAFT_480340 [Lentinus tigrinus ALCF2SS1-7]|uniref:Uncharacterized protein n=1 Tax=Lentinus tigrinus ALCF2SS1-6 TaxID=1328759 RepID=A0A5C2RM62_9APHY|nr:hypothetical protein L227DRAFT_581957 [Lentinus tigrinus ALCF2SS1-6]RPD79456.1 hypothetical protein L226DRAFT_480340 [Lentinus tigrinus ALCF2SS1-7]